TVPNAPQDASLDGATGIVTWIPDHADGGLRTFTIIAADLAGNTATQQVSLLVEEPPPPPPPPEPIVGVRLVNNTLVIVGSVTRDKLDISLAHHKLQVSGSLGELR